MNQQKITTGFVLIGTILFHTFFWGEKMGINILLFTIFILGAYFFMDGKKQLSKYAVFTAICTFAMAVVIVINNSLLSKVMYGISFTTMVGFVHQKELNFLFYGWLQALLNLEVIPKSLFSKMEEKENPLGNWQRSWVYFRISILPVLFLGVFYILYAAANPKFAELSGQTWTYLFSFFQWDISFQSVLFFIMGFWIVGAALWKADIPHIVRLNNRHTEQLIRQRKSKNYSIGNPKMLGLKNEFHSAIIMIGLLNLLLVFVNVIDIRFVWFDFEEQPAYSLKNYVHEGTYLLIASILLAMGIIIYYFRGNLNFYKKNKTLQYLTYAWIFQNAILAYSVGMRNYRYIEYHGLAYKRIGVMIFLVAVIIGLISMFKKVQEQKSFYFLVNRNAWAVYTLMILVSLVNWDVAITRYNILVETKRPLDVEFLAEGVSDKNLFLLQKYNNEITKKLPRGYSLVALEKRIARKEQRFKNEQAEYSWLSWNYADFRNKEKLGMK